MRKQKLPRRYYSVPELARAYSVSDQFIYNLIVKGIIKTHRLGKRHLVPTDQEEALAERIKRGAAA